MEKELLELLLLLMPMEAGATQVAGDARTAPGPLEEFNAPRPSYQQASTADRSDGNVSERRSFQRAANRRLSAKPPYHIPKPTSPERIVSTVRKPNKRIMRIDYGYPVRAK